MAYGIEVIAFGALIRIEINVWKNRDNKKQKQQQQPNISKSGK